MVQFCVLDSALGFYCLGAEHAHSGGPESWEPASVHWGQNVTQDQIPFLQNDHISFLFW